MPSLTKSSLAQTLNEKEIKLPSSPKEPAWLGPEVDGISQSLLSGYLSCKERFRIHTVLGLQQAEKFSKALEFGNMWHLCEELFAENLPWEDRLKAYAQDLCRKFQFEQEQVQKWYNVCRVQFPVYVEHWKKHPDVKGRTPISQEEVFKIPYELPSGRTVYLRGKFDSVDHINKKGIYLQENKTKGQIVEEDIRKRLSFDLQTNLYLIALKLKMGDLAHQVKGVRYNVIRRPLSGGKGSIRPHQGTKTKPPEKMSDYYNRLKVEYIEKEPEYWFQRWKCEVGAEDLEKFEEETLIPVLENLCDDYEWWGYCLKEKIEPFAASVRELEFPHHHPQHFRYPYGVWNPTADGFQTDIDEYLATGSTVGLVRVNSLFPELN